MVSPVAVSYPYGPAVAGRGLLIRRQVIERSGSAAWRSKDISDARWEYRIRAWDPAAAAPTFLFDEVCAKGATAATAGWLDHYVELGGDAQPTLAWEIVEVDTAAPSVKPTPSGSREVVLEAWAQPVAQGPLA